MKQPFQFKTNINCSGCIAKVTPFLDEQPGIQQWEVDTLNPDKILSVQSETLPAEKIIEILEAAGFRAEEVA